jgi:hypothetical protein
MYRFVLTMVFLPLRRLVAQDRLLSVTGTCVQGLVSSPRRHQSKRSPHHHVKQFQEECILVLVACGFINDTQDDA